MFKFADSFAGKSAGAFLLIAFMSSFKSFLSCAERKSKKSGSCPRIGTS